MQSLLFYIPPKLILTPSGPPTETLAAPAVALTPDEGPVPIPAPLVEENEVGCEVHTPPAIGSGNETLENSRITLLNISSLATFSTRILDVLVKPESSKDIGSSIASNSLQLVRFGLRLQPRSTSDAKRQLGECARVSFHFHDFCTIPKLILLTLRIARCVRMNYLNRFTPMGCTNRRALWLSQRRSRE